MKKFSFFEKSRVSGFTLIELLVVIAIIAILTGIIVTNLAQSRAKSRDAARISDLSQLQLALELYFERCNSYPASLATGNSCNTLNGNVALSEFISVIPTPPTGSNENSYRYDTNGSATDYVLATKLENNNEALNDDLDDVHIDAEIDVDDCDDAGFNYCVGPK